MEEKTETTYIGATNDMYRRGFCYEKKAGETVQGLVAQEPVSIYKPHNIVLNGEK